MDQESMERYHERERQDEIDEAIASSALLAAAVELHKRSHQACPFMTLNSGPEGATVQMKFKDYEDASDVHRLLVKFFSANSQGNPPSGSGSPTCSKAP